MITVSSRLKALREKLKQQQAGINDLLENLFVVSSPASYNRTMGRSLIRLMLMPRNREGMTQEEREQKKQGQ